MKSKLNELEIYYQTLQDNQEKLDATSYLFTEKKKEDNVKTGDQQLKDSDVIQTQEKTIALIWGIVSISMFFIIFFRPRLNTT